MPFFSESQRKKFYAMADRGEISPKTVAKWEAHTPKDKPLPGRVKSSELGGLHSELQKIAGGRLQRAADVLMGRPADALFHRHLQKATSSSLIKPFSNMETTEGFISDVLRGKKPVPQVGDLPRATSGRVQLVRQLAQGQKAVAGARRQTQLARVGTGAALAVPAIIAAKTAEDRSALPALAGVAAGAMPIVQGLRTGALGAGAPGGRQYKSIQQLQKKLRPGDVLLTGSAGKAGTFKPMITAMGGSPFGHHVEVVAKAPKRGGPTFVHATPGEGGASAFVPELGPGDDMTIRRFRSAKQRKAFLKNIDQRWAREDMLENVFGAKARGSMYDTGQAVRASVGSFLPSKLVNLFSRGSSSPGAAVCSSLVGQASPACIMPGVKGENVLPHHVLRSRALDTVGYYRAPRTLRAAAYDRMLQATPWLTRGALGAGLGYGAYRAAKALTD